MTNKTDRKPWSVIYEPELDTQQFLTWLQNQHAAWERVNFPTSEKEVFHSLAGMTEELGELAHAILKDAQSIRGDHEKHMLDGQDAVGDLFIYCAGLCNKMGWNMQQCIYKAWREVGSRDWTKNKETGVDPEAHARLYKQDSKGDLADDGHLVNGEDW